MALNLTQSLPSLVRAKYATAEASKALTFSATELSIVRVSGMRFQLRYCPALASKPKQSKDHHQQHDSLTKKKFDPFDGPDTNLLIERIPRHDPSHLLVLNKYPVIPNHFILATVENKPQTHLLQEDDLWLTYRCMEEWRRAGRESAHGEDTLFAFFNSGEHSGASQPHRHLQLLPVREMGFDVRGGDWRLLADCLMDEGRVQDGRSLTPAVPVDLSTRSSLPFRCFGTRLPESLTPEQLHELYVKMYMLSESAVREYIHRHPNATQLHATADGALPISYNLAMTTDSLLVCPRLSGGKAIRREDGMELDTVELNGTMLGGTLMVKNEEVYRILKGGGGLLDGVLEAVGLPVGRPGGSEVNL